MENWASAIGTIKQDQLHFYSVLAPMDDKIPVVLSPHIHGCSQLGFSTTDAVLHVGRCPYLTLAEGEPKSLSILDGTPDSSLGSSSSKALAGIHPVTSTPHSKRSLARRSRRGWCKGTSVPGSSDKPCLKL